MNHDLWVQDQKARRAALDSRKSFIVQAPAGSGKTELLIQRFLTLLNHVKTPEEILAITFTKKSSNEMRTRVLNALKAAEEAEPISAHAKQTWHIAKQVLARDAELNWNLLNNPNRLRIQTIDSFCTYLTKQLPLLSHFGSQPEINMYPASLYRDAVKEILLHVEDNYEWSEAISKLLLHLDNDYNKLHDLLVNLLERRDQWIPFITLDTNNAEIKRQLEYQLRAVVCDSLDNLLAIFPVEIEDELLAIARYAANNLIASKTVSPLCQCAELTNLPGANAKDLPLWLGISELLLTKDGTYRKAFNNNTGFPAPSATKDRTDKELFSYYKNRISALMEKIRDNAELCSALAALASLPNTSYDESQWQILQSLLLVLKIIAAQLRVAFTQHGQIDFIENAQAALLALGNEESPTDLALALDYQIRHILVDEFQDTSFTQYQLLEKLTTGWQTGDGRTLFVVGDPMQSIYRFRQAEVGLFIRMRKNGLGNIDLVPLTLAVNFRALAPIVEWNNQHFSQIFPAFNDIATGAVTYSHSIAHNADEHNKAQISTRALINNDEIINEIHTIRKDNPQERIAILVRSRSHLSDLIPALNKANLAYKAIEIDPLSTRQHIQDLLALTCALIHIGDRIAWLSILRAPWCGLKLADLLIIAGSDDKISIWEQITNANIIKQLTNDAQQRLARIAPIIKSKLDERERYDLRSWIESTWLLLGGPATLNDTAEIADVAEYFKLLTAFTQSSRLLNIERLKERMNTLFAAAQDDESAIQIMTIHAAKGLEFDTVILPHIERKIPSDDKSLLHWMDRPLNNNKNVLLLAPIHGIGNEKDSIYEYINLQERIRANYEIDRLFYVATTRAKKRLLIYFNLTETETGGYRIDGGSFLSRLWPLIEKDCEKPALNIEETTTTTPIRHIKRLTDNWINPINEASKYKIAYHNKESGFALTDNTPKTIGVVIHRILQQISLSGTSWWQTKNEDEKKAYIHHHLKQHGLSGIPLVKGYTVTKNALETTLKDERGTWILQPHTEASSEFTLSAKINGKIENLILDRTFIANGTRWIIDYKTTTFSRADMEKEQEKYEEKMRLYHDAIKVLDTRPIRLGLYFPALPAWHEWSF